jgi:hypothetical protein
MTLERVSIVGSSLHENSFCQLSCSGHPVDLGLSELWTFK